MTGWQRGAQVGHTARAGKRAVEKALGGAGRALHAEPGPRTSGGQVPTGGRTALKPHNGK